MHWKKRRTLGQCKSAGSFEENKFWIIMPSWLILDFFWKYFAVHSYLFDTIWNSIWNIKFTKYKGVEKWLLCEQIWDSNILEWPNIGVRWFLILINLIFSKMVPEAEDQKETYLWKFYVFFIIQTTISVVLLVLWCILFMSNYTDPKAKRCSTFMKP